MNAKRSLYCLLILLCCLPIFSVMAQDVTLPAPVATVVEPVVTLVDPIVTVVEPVSTSDSSVTATSVPTIDPSVPTTAPGDAPTLTPDASLPMSTSDAEATSAATADMMATAAMMATAGTMMLPPDENARTIGDIIVFQSELNVPEFTMLRQALENTGLLATLMRDDINYAFFAPTDAAFAALPQDIVQMLMTDPVRLRFVLLNHIVPGYLIDAQETMTTAMLRTLPAYGGNTLSVVTNPNGSTIVNNISTTVRIDASNGYIYVIDAALIPGLTMPIGIDGLMPMATMDATALATMEATMDMTTEAPMATMDMTMEATMDATMDMTMDATMDATMEATQAP